MAKCLFCGKDAKETGIFIRSKKTEGMGVCDDCLRRAFEKCEKEKKTRAFKNPSLFTPQNIYEKLNRIVVGQEEAKKVLSVALYNHKKRLDDKTGLIGKSNILMAGPSGSGKTLLARSLAGIIDVPFVVADATSFTEAGYVGEDVESLLLRLLAEAEGNVNRAQTGIVFIDEIDKLAGSGDTVSAGKRNPTSEGVQYALLKLIEGETVYLKRPDVPMSVRKIPFDTSKVLFICSGAFEGLFDREQTKSMGFNNVLSSEGEEKDMDTDNLRTYGMKQEFIGRLPIRVKLDELTRDDLRRIMTEPEGAITKEYAELLRSDGIELEFTDEALLKIADTAIRNKTGARGLRTIMENIMTDIMFEAPDHGEYEKIIITEDTVESKKPEIVLRKKDLFTDEELVKESMRYVRAGA